jgi:thymidylate kinase
MIFVIDGNDGTGKSTLIEKLRKLGYDVKDRGLPTLLTDNPKLKPVRGEFYIILDAPVEVCQERLKKAGRDLNEKYHTLKDLIYYREKFLDIANNQLKGNCIVINASSNQNEVLEHTLNIINKLKNRQT